jgi:hypothetical protein
MRPLNLLNLTRPNAALSRPDMPSELRALLPLMTLAGNPNTRAHKFRGFRSAREEREFPSPELMAARQSAC